MLSLASFAGMKESTESLPEDEEILLFSGAKAEKEKNTKKRKASPDCNVQDESDMFPQTTSAFTAQSTRRVKRRTSNVPPPFNVEKKSKYDDSSDDDSVIPHCFDTLTTDVIVQSPVPHAQPTELSQRFGDKYETHIEQSSIEYAQPIEQPILNKVSRKTTGKNVKKLNKHAQKKPCKYLTHHTKLALIGLKEEDNNKFLNKGCVMEDMHCTKCGRCFVKNDKMEPNKTHVTVFNTKRPALCCEELHTSGQFVCKFAICHDCKINLLNNDDNKSKGRSNRRARQKN